MPTIDTLGDWNARLGCCCEMPSCPVPTIDYEIKFGTGDSETVAGDPEVVTPHGLSHAIDEAMANLATDTYPNPLYGSHEGFADLAVFESVGMYGDPPVELPYFVVDAYAMRFRWVIPDTFTGSYFQITWDIGEYPDEGSPSISSADNTWEWTGPGDPEVPDSCKSGWYEILPPSSAGLRRVVNIRFVCWRSDRYGYKPQVTGTAL